MLLSLCMLTFWIKALSRNNYQPVDISYPAFVVAICLVVTHFKYSYVVIIMYELPFTNALLCNVIFISYVQNNLI